MNLELTEKTKTFIKDAKWLVENGIIKSYAQLATDINWNRTALSQVLAGTRNVPNDVYKRFQDAYRRTLTHPTPEKPVFPLPPLEGQIDAVVELQGKYIALLEAKVGSREDSIVQLKGLLQEQQQYLGTILQEIQLNRAFAKVCFLALQKIRSEVEKQPLEQIEADMDKDLAAFAEELLQKGN